MMSKGVSEMEREREREREREGEREKDGEKRGVCENNQAVIIIPSWGLDV